jgi:hypothetical protein
MSPGLHNIDSRAHASLTGRKVGLFLEPEQKRRGGGPRPLTVAERVSRFWSRVDKNPNGCWLWTGSTFPTGYGMVACGRTADGHTTTDYAHRVAYWLTTGEVPTVGLEIIHACDLPLCVRPDHLRLGTHAENMADAQAKGRLFTGPRPEQPGGHRKRGRKFLTPEERETIRAMRKAGVTAKAIATQFNLSPWHVIKIGTGTHKTVLELAREHDQRLSLRRFA